MDILKTIDRYLTEKYLNLLDKDTKQKQQYKDEVWSILTAAYEGIGGIKGTGFSNPNDMVKNIPFWKLGFVGTRLVAVVMYKFVEGERKLVAIGATHDNDGKKRLNEIADKEFSRSYAEISDPLLGWLAKKHPQVIKKYRIPSATAEKIIVPEIHIIDKYFYSRKIGGESHTKMLIGQIPSKYR